MPPKLVLDKPRLVLEEPHLVLDESKSWKQVIEHGAVAGGMGMLEAGAGGAEIIGRFLKPQKEVKPLIPSLNRFWERTSEKLTQWGQKMSEAVEGYRKEHPEEMVQYEPVEGGAVKRAFGVAGQLVKDPKKLTQEIIQTVPMLSEAALGYMTLGGTLGPRAARTIGMALPLIGQTYAEARREGTSPDKALTQSILTGTIEAGIEEWTLGKKIKLFQAASKGMAGRAARLLLGAPARGAAEEWSQEVNKNFWNKIFTDPTQEIFAGAAEAAGAGGVIEGVLAGGFAASGKIVSGKIKEGDMQLTKEEKVEKVENIRKTIEQAPNLTPEHKAEINEELDKVKEDVLAGKYEAKPAGKVEGLTGERLRKRLRQAQKDLTPETKQAFGEMSFDETSKRLISEDGTMALQWYSGYSPQGYVRIDKLQPPAPAPKAQAAEGKAEKQVADITQKPARPIPKETVTPPAVQREMSQKNLGPVNLTTESQSVEALDRYWKLRDEAEFDANVDEANNQKAIAEALGKKKYDPDVDVETARTSQAMMLYIDLKEHPSGHEFAKQLTGEQKQIYESSQNLPPDIRRVADQITAQNKKAGLLLKDQDVIRNARENYIAHLWRSAPRKQRLFAKFRQKTARALPRKLEGGIVEGWTRGMVLEVKDIAAASRIARQQGTRALAGKKLLDTGKDWGLMGHKQLEGWERVEHPNFTIWRHAGKAEPGKVYGRDLYVNEKGELFEKSPVYAEPKLAKKLNKIFSPSALYKLPGVETITFYNDQIKATILLTAFFHHQAFLRSNMLGGRTVNVKKSWQMGKQAIENKEPELRLLVRNGMTIGRIQDYDPSFLTSRQTIWGRALSQTNLTEKGRKWIVNLRNKQIKFLFYKMGPYLKAGTALVEFQAEVIKNKTKLERGEITIDKIAKSVAVLMNNDFGGLHLGRLGRSGTAQHIFKLIALAPDWTESNIKSAVQMLNKGEMGRVHRLFWGRIAAKGLGATIAMNLLLAAFDDEDFLTRYQKAWETGRLRWLDIDITPIYRALGGESERRKYFSLIGHFRDPLKFIVHPFISAKHKASVVGRIMMDMMIGQDWAGREFTTLGELTGIAEKGKLSGRLVKWGRGKARPIEPTQAPSYLLYETRSAMPIPIQNAIAFVGGEMDAFDAIAKSLGLMTFTTYPQEKGKGVFGGKKSIFRKRRKKSIFRKAG